jgi:hypothetical protein
MKLDIEWNYDASEPNGCSSCPEPHNGSWYMTMKIGKARIYANVCARCKKKIEKEMEG